MTNLRKSDSPSDPLFSATAAAYAQNRRPVRWLVGRFVYRDLCRHVGIVPVEDPIGEVRLLGLPVVITDAPVGFGLVVR